MSFFSPASALVVPTTGLVESTQSTSCRQHDNPPCLDLPQPTALRMLSGGGALSMTAHAHNFYPLPVRYLAGRSITEMFIAITQKVCPFVQEVLYCVGSFVVDGALACARY